ncbi:MAG TPA: hypothetical protein VEW92_13330 [Nitrososphaeraceae archaeon]|jgi:hypothetical protein|nr:hypothetical protein [Nitrososphaeraceae archaeon]
MVSFCANVAGINPAIRTNARIGKIIIEWIFDSISSLVKYHK